MEEIMELRELEYFLMIIRCGSLSEASRKLHLSQPALTRSLKQLETELGKQLVIRGSRQIQLTQDGQLLRRRAEEILQLTEKARKEIQISDLALEGDIYVCAGETKALHFLTQAYQKLRLQHPGIRLHISSGDARDVLTELKEGLVDFGVMYPPIDEQFISSIRIPFEDEWGLIMRKDHPLSSKAVISSKDLMQVPLIIPRELYETHRTSRFLNIPEEELQIAATYTLSFNGTLMVTDGVGCLLGLNHIINLTENTVNCFRPLSPSVTQNIHVCWKRYAPMSRPAGALLDVMRKMNADEQNYWMI